MENKLFKIDNFIKKDKDNSFNENYYDNCIKKNEINNNFNPTNNKVHSLCLDNNSNEYYNYFNVIHSINKNENINIGKNKKEKSSGKKSKNIHKKTLKINSRSSKYRGVSKNGNKWQVHIMINKKNKYLSIFIRKVKFSTGGLLAYYDGNVRCVHDYILKRYIPIIDLISHPNIFNGFNTSVTKNPWEVFFNQPFNYTLDIVNKKGEIIKYAECYGSKKGPNFQLLKNNTIREYWHKIASKYIPIKSEIIKEANSKFKLLFSDSINVLGVLMRGTDYIAKNKKMDKKFKYKWIFLTTEDDLIREKFIKEFKKKLKYIKSKTNINYDYKRKELLAFNKNIKGNLEYMKTYLVNIIILSKCIDIITSKTAGAIVAFILTNGFRNKKIYDLGYYK